MELIKLQPTPIQKMNVDLNQNTFYIKRDDLLPISFGGNKVRKAKLFFEDLLQQEANCVVTYGSSSSNHCRIIANIAAAKGIVCHIISPSETGSRTTNQKIIELFNAYVTNCSISEVSKTIEDKMNELRSQGYHPYFIQGGGHGDLGTQAYVDAYQEILDYEKATGLHFDYIFHTSGTGTTQAGLICGQILNHDERKIIGISNARRNPYGSQVVLDSVNSYLENNNKKEVTIESVNFVDDYILQGYGSYDERILITIRDVLRYEGIPLDPVYTGKAFWGMKEYIKANQILLKNILFIHTGGTPLFFDKLEELIHG